MKKPPRDILRLPIEKRAEIALKVAVAKAIDENIRLGIPVYIWRKGKVVKLSPREARNSSIALKHSVIRQPAKHVVRKIGKDGRVTIPVELRRKFGFTPGTKVRIQLRQGGFVVRCVEG